MPDDKQADGGAPPSAIVAISASATSTRSLEHLLAQLPLEGVAAIVVLQKREALDDAPFHAALAAAGRTVETVRDGAALESGRIYLPAANVIATVRNGCFHTRIAEQAPGRRGVIDSLLVSLADSEDGRVLAVALAGTDGDGTLGVQTVKAAGGLSLAEAPVDYEDLGLSSSPAAIADAVLKADALVGRVVRLIRQITGRREDSQPLAPDLPEVKAALASIAMILRNKTGHDFHGYKPGTFLRRVQRRMHVAEVEDLSAYVDLLRDTPDEAQNLFNDLLISVTEFFRDRREFELLEREAIPKLFEGKTRNDPLRVWVVGCATGEEAYSIAILLREHMAKIEQVPQQVQIFATDLDGRALAWARAGRYAQGSVEALSPERLSRWFVREGDTFCVVKELREMCIFSQHSVIKDAPFSRLDLICCRNLLIYLEASLQSRVIPLFHFALRPGGFLFLGNSENVSRHTSLFTAIEPRSRVFRRLDSAARILPDFPFTSVSRRPEGIVSVPVAPPRDDGGDLVRRAERFAERFAPAYVIVDHLGTVLHFSGRAGRYIDPAGGTATLNLLQLAHPDLRLDLRAALTRAAEQGGAVQVDGVRMRLGERALAVDLVVEAAQDDAPGQQTFFVLFREGAPPPAEGTDPPPAQDERTALLEADLRATRDRLQATIEELESTNEELKSSNEEYQSLNEELQSANEELETSKEELQSVNEELTTVNGELAHRVQELGRTNSDLKNFFESTHIATVFLDNDLRVTNFTPAAADVFHLVDSDLGRPVGHIKPRVAYDDMQDDARRVLRTLTAIEREIDKPQTQERYIARILPYRSTDNFIAGVVLTFVDITARRHAEELLRQREERYRTLFDEMHEGFALCQPLPDAEGRTVDIRYVELNRAMAAQFGLGQEQMAGHTMGELVARADLDSWLAAHAHMMQTREPLQFEHRMEAQGRWYEVSAYPRHDGLFAVFYRDTTRRKAAELAIRESEERQAFLLRLSDELRALGEPGAIRAAASRLVGQQLGLDRAAYGEVRGDRLVVLDAWGPELPPIAGTRILLSDLAGPFAEDYRAGRVVVVRDVARDLRFSPEERALLSRAGIGAYIAVTLVKDGLWIAMFGGQTQAPREWTEAEIAIVQGVAERTWAAAERARAEAALVESERRLRVLMEGIPQLVWRSAEAGQWIWSGPQWVAFTGLSPEASLGLGWLEAVHPDDHVAVHDAWSRAGGAGIFAADFRVRSVADGTWHWFQSRGLPVHGHAEPGDSQPREWLGSSTDIDDQMRARDALSRSAEDLEQRVSARTAELMAAEETLRQSQKMEAIGQLTGGIAHDFNNMLQGVAGGVDMAGRRVRAGRVDEAMTYLEAVRDSADRAAGLTRRLLAFARKQPLEPQHLDLDRLVDGLADLIRRSVGPAVEVELSLANSAASVLCDRNEMESALLNLCINARDAMPHGGRLRIATRDIELATADLVGQEGALPGRFMEVRVEDTGTGMAPAVLERVLEPFFTTKPSGEGTGLGLTQVYGVVRQSSGALYIDSTPGQGTSVRLCLPCETRAAEAAAAPPGPPAQVDGDGAAILLVDDETHVRVPAAERLRDLGYRVTEAADGPAALRLLDGGLRPDLLVTDVGLPGETDGVRLSAEVQRRLPGIAILFVTGYATTALPPWAKVLSKPFGLDALGDRVATVLATRPAPTDSSATCTL